VELLTLCLTTNPESQTTPINESQGKAAAMHQGALGDGSTTFPTPLVFY